MIKYRSKISWVLASFIFIVLTVCCIGLPANAQWEGLYILLPTMAFVVHLYCTTYYIIENNWLTVRAGFFKKKISITSVRKIVATNSILSAPALSMDRLELFYDGFESIVISPKDQEAFIKHIQQVNPAITFQPK